jgi:hypothetical protein
VGDPNTSEIDVAALREALQTKPGKRWFIREYLDPIESTCTTLLIEADTLAALLDDKERADHASGVLDRVWEALGGEDDEFDQVEIVERAAKLRQVADVVLRLVAPLLRELIESPQPSSDYDRAFAKARGFLDRLQGSEAQP